MIIDIDANKISVSNKLSFDNQDFKCFIGYKDYEKIWPLCLFRPEMIIYNRNFDENKRIIF